MSIGYFKPLYSYGVRIPAALQLILNMMIITSVGDIYCLITLAAYIANLHMEILVAPNFIVGGNYCTIIEKTLSESISMGEWDW